MLRLILPEPPVPWSRTRAGDARGRVRILDPKLKSWYGRLADEARSEMGIYEVKGLPSEGPFTVRIMVTYGSKKVMQRHPPDGDNIVKGIFDALTDVVWVNDTIIKIPVFQFKAVVDWVHLPEDGVLTSIHIYGAAFDKVPVFI